MESNASDERGEKEEEEEEEEYEEYICLIVKLDTNVFASTWFTRCFM